MAHGTPLSRRRPRSIVVGITYVALGIIIGTAITFGIRGYVGDQISAVEGRQLLEAMNPNPRRAGPSSAKDDFMGGEALSRRLADTEDFPDITELNLDSLIDTPADNSASTAEPPKMSRLLEPLLKLLGVGRWYADDIDDLPDVVHLYSEHDFKQAMVAARGFDWSEAQQPGHPPQWAYVGDKAGSYLDLKLDTRTSTSRDGAPHAPIVLTHWRGPSGMGQADISCLSGCECAMTRINGHWDEPSSGTWGHPFTVSQSADCVLRIQILPAKHGSSKTKVKLAELIVLDDPVPPKGHLAAVSGIAGTTDSGEDRPQEA